MPKHTAAKRAMNREKAVKKVIGSVLKPSFRGLGKVLGGTGKLINKGLSKVDAHAKRVRAKRKKK